MTFKRLVAVTIWAVLAAVSLDAAAVSDENCTMIEQSVSTGKAVASVSTIYVAVSAKDPSIVNAKYPAKTAKRMLQSMFLKYCGDFSGYKSFVVEAHGGVSGSAICNGKRNYAFAIKKSAITIRELSASDPVQSVEIPDFDSKADPFEEFR